MPDSPLVQFGDEPFWLSTDLRLLGIMALEKGDWSRAEPLLVQALESARESRYPWAIASTLHNLAHLHHLRNDLERSLARFLESLQISIDQRDYWPLAVTFPPVAEVLVSLGEIEQAARLFGAAGSLGESMIVRLSATIPVVESQERARAKARDALGDSEFDLCWNAGRSLTPEQAVDDVRRKFERRRETSASAALAVVFPSGLSMREVEVIRLVSAGKTNAQVAERLFLSRRTVDAHLRRVYDKLDLTSRSQLVRFTHDNRLL
ncbi:MAG: response regulator transcription factor [Thermomicrobiales bacterium]